MTNYDILDHIPHEEEQPVLPLADRGIRFVNYFIDRVVLLAGSFLFGIFLVLIDKGELLYVIDDGGIVMDYIFGVFLGTFYYSLFEFGTGGRTIGKLLTGTKVISDDGLPLTYPQVLGRTLSRFVPFEPFSFFGDEPLGWHDSWSGTRVVKLR